MGLDEPDNDIGTPLESSPPLVEHGAGLADSGRRAEVHTETPGWPYSFVFTACAHVTLLDPTAPSHRYNSKSARRRRT